MLLVSGCWVRVSILSSASFRRDSQILRREVPSSNLARRSARGMSPVSMAATRDSSCWSACSNGMVSFVFFTFAGGWEGEWELGNEKVVVGEVFENVGEKNLS